MKIQKPNTTVTVILATLANLIVVATLFKIMPVVNTSSFLRFIVTTECFLVFSLFLTVRQFIEALKPRDALTGMRYLILAVLILTILTLIPSIVYQFFRSIGQDYEILRNFVTTISGINLIGFTVLFVLIFTYRVRK